MITIIDYGAGNIGSIENMIKKVGGKSRVTSNLDEIYDSEKLILPGVGAFDYGMRKLKEKGIDVALQRKVIEEKIPILGICLGMQLMTLKSEEGIEKGLGWFNAEVKKFQTTDEKIKVPHMGWNLINVNKKSRLFNELSIERRFYFVHSYYVESNIETEVLSETNYINKFTSGLERDNIFALQFHPEKSHKFGMDVMLNFLNI